MIIKVKWRVKERKRDHLAGSSKASKVDASLTVPQQEVASFVVEEGDDVGVPSTKEAVGAFGSYTNKTDDIIDAGGEGVSTSLVIVQMITKNKLEGLGLI